MLWNRGVPTRGAWYVQVSEILQHCEGLHYKEASRGFSGTREKVVVGL